MEPTAAPLGTEEEFASMLARLATEYAPARFALCAEEPVRVEAEIIAWGVDVGDGVVVCPLNGELPWRASSAERAGLLSGWGGPVRVVWVDRTTPDEAGEAVERPPCATSIQCG
jgi:hypothetical protein